MNLTISNTLIYGILVGWISLGVMIYLIKNYHILTPKNGIVTEKKKK